MTDIVTLKLDADSQAFFEAMRQRHFPPERNQIGAHLTLFHTLPGTAEIADVLRRVAGQHAAFMLQVTGLRSLGKGVAYTLRSAELQAVHAELSEAYVEHLSPQDRQRFMPHVVVQNKAQPAEARALLAEMQAGFQPFAVQAVGLELWNYLGGPWRLAEEFGFRAE